MSVTEAAEWEASEVLHSLLSVERIEVKTSPDSNLEPVVEKEGSHHQWHTPVTTNPTDPSVSGNTGAEETTPALSESLNTAHEDSLSDTVDVEETDPNDLFDLSSFVQTEISNPPSAKKRIRKKRSNGDSEAAPTELETSSQQVMQRFLQGCECQGECFRHLQAENVYRHRLNVAELTKEEHDMYLMGVTMACLANRKETSRHKERIRQRASYVYQGKRVCLDAFLYLENVTQYHLKRIRLHVMTNGVIPRVHGNIGKKPHNTFSLDMYKDAEKFVKNVIAENGNDMGKPFLVLAEARASIYQRFKETIPPEGKVMGYSTFRHFMKKQFPHVRFATTRIQKKIRQEESGTVMEAPSNSTFWNEKDSDDSQSGQEQFDVLPIVTAKSIL